jgi:hypothetical protein
LMVRSVILPRPLTHLATVYNAHLDSIAIHERLAEEFAMVKADGRGEPSMDALADKVQRVQASALSDRPAFATVRHAFAADTLQ